MRVAHFVEQYPVKEHGFIYDQIQVTGDRQDIVLCSRCTEDTPHTSPHRVVPILDLLDNRVFRSATSQRVFTHLTRRYFRAPYVRVLGEAVSTHVNKLGVDIVHAHFGMAAATLTEVKAFTDVPLVTTFYGVDASACLLDSLWREPYQALFEVGDLFVVLSQAVAERLARFGCPAEKIVTWNIGIDLSRYSYHERAANPSRIALLCVARFVEKKGHDVLLEAVSQIAARRDVSLTLIGYGQLRGKIERRVAELGIQNSVKLIDTTNRNDFQDLFERALSEHDIFVLPSTVARDGDDEGGPALTLVCAQASGMPVVCTPFVGAERSVTHGETGLICEPNSSHSLALTIEQLVESPELRLKIGKAGTERVLREFSLECQRQAMARHYRTILNSRR